MSETETVLEKKAKKFYASVRMVKAYRDWWLRKPSFDDVMEALADAIKHKQIDDLFQVEFE